eukprot:comp10226_c0_seq2/m.5048 comp10226_c0_seq2/g.5048  ORF comp10226_c0_seq2/g.5048 comp10226_c0_seq2/m.5048 type:complete len:313 (-) comp10226_c0_seq2:257-1195(-)
MGSTGSPSERAPLIKNNVCLDDFELPPQVNDELSCFAVHMGRCSDIPTRIWELRGYIKSLHLSMLVQAVMGCMAVYLCLQHRILFEINFLLWTTPVVFPLGFSINANYNRRELALGDIAEFKCAATEIYFNIRDWQKSTDLDSTFAVQVAQMLSSFATNIVRYLTSKDEAACQHTVKVIYGLASDISAHCDVMRTRLPNSSPLVSGMIQNHKQMLFAFEKMRLIKEYKAPRSMKMFTTIFVWLIPLLAAPTFAKMSDQNGLWAGLYVSILVSVMFGCLLGVQDDLDDPFDQLGMDDINFKLLRSWVTDCLTL